MLGDAHKTSGQVAALTRTCTQEGREQAQLTPATSVLFQSYCPTAGSSLSCLMQSIVHNLRAWGAVCMVL